MISLVTLSYKDKQTKSSLYNELFLWFSHILRVCLLK